MKSCLIIVAREKYFLTSYSYNMHSSNDFAHVDK